MTTMYELDFVDDVRERILIRAFGLYLHVKSVRDMLDQLPYQYPYKSETLKTLMKISTECIMRRRTASEEVLTSYLKAGGNEDSLIEVLKDENFRFENLPMGTLRETVDYFIGSNIANAVDDTTGDYNKHRIELDEYLYNIKSIAEGSKTMSDIVVSMQELIEKYENPHMGNGIDVFPEWMNERMKGLRRSRVTLLASRPGVGKTDFSLDLMRRAVENDYSVLHVSMEMDAMEILSRMYNAVGREKYKAMVSNKLFSVISEGRVSIPQIASIVNGEKYDMVVIDYLQQLGLKERTNSLYEKTSVLSNELRIAAKNSTAAWLVLSQFSRNARDEHSKPVLSDLRESGSLEQDAFAVILGYEPEERVKSHNVYAPDRMVTWMIAKNRGGGIGHYSYRFRLAESTWTQMKGSESESFSKDEMEKLKAAEVRKQLYDN